jgi:trimeric autotransporter adhesin
MGTQACGSVLTGATNVALGYFSANALTSGSDNVYIGSSSGSESTTPDDNVFVGAHAGTYNTTGHSNTFIGYRAAADDETTAAGTNVTTGSNLTNLGFKARASSFSATNQVTLGNSSITTLRCQVTSITALSDARDKTNVAPLHAGLDFVERLAPVSFDWNMRDGGKVGVADTGFIAQDLQQVQQDTGVEIPGLVFDNNPDKLEAAYGKLVPVLVQALKELSAKVTALEAQINS